MNGGEQQMISVPVAQLSERLARIEEKVNAVIESQARIEGRLDRGDRRFKDLDDRMECLETDKKAIRVGWKLLTGIATLAAALGAGLTKGLAALAGLAAR